MIVIGIDPGRDGAYALHNGTDIIQAAPFPALGKEVDWRALAHVLSLIRPALVVIERVASMPKQGVASAFTFGHNAGCLFGICLALDYPIALVLPPRWKGLILDGYSKEDRASKAGSIHYVTRRYPKVSLLRTARSRVPHDGIADACCIAEWGARAHGFAVTADGSPSPAASPPGAP